MSVITKFILRLTEEHRELDKGKVVPESYDSQVCVTLQFKRTALHLIYTQPQTCLTQRHLSTQTDEQNMQQVVVTP